MITHVVLMHFKNENKEENMARAHDLLLSMVGKVESLRHLEVGLNTVEGERALDLALVTRFAPRARIVLWLLLLVLVVIVAIQVWLGILLLFDTTTGPINSFNAATTAAAML